MNNLRMTTVLAVLGAIAALAGVVLWNVGEIYAAATPATFTWQGYAFGSAGALAALTGILTVAGAFLTVWMLIVRADHDRNTLAQATRLEIATRFKNAGELLADGSPVMARAGISMLTAIILQREGEQYALPTAQMLLASATARDRDIKDQLNLFDTDIALSPGIRWRRSDPATAWCLQAATPIIQALVAVGRHSALQRDEDRINIEDLYLTAMTLPNWTAHRIHVLRTYLAGVTFQDCDFTGSIFDCAVLPFVVFRNCTLDDVNLRCFDQARREIHLDRLPQFIQIEGTGGSRRDLRCWGDLVT